MKMPRLIVVAFSFCLRERNRGLLLLSLKQYYSSGSGNYSGDSSATQKVIRHEHLSEVDFL